MINGYADRIDHDGGRVVAGPWGALHVGLCALLESVAGQRGVTLPEGLTYNPYKNTVSGKIEAWGAVISEGLHDDLERLQIAVGTVVDKNGNTIDYRGLITWRVAAMDGVVSVTLGPYWSDQLTASRKKTKLKADE